MATVRISVNTDAETKQNAERVFEAIGLNMTTAINVFLKKSIQYKGIPFELCAEIPNDTTLAALKEGDERACDPDRKGYDSVEELMKALNNEIQD